MLLSGPAGGVLGAMQMARHAGFEYNLTHDVGGTSTDLSLFEKLTPTLTSHSYIENYPVKTPMLDIATVGSGGGSLAWTDRYGQLKVGPRSAGAEPGPICYGRGGTQPTVTDAALVLGRLPAALIGGELGLNHAAARKAYEALGAKFKMSAEEAAAGVMEIAAATQVHGIRQVTTTRGRDPGDYALVAFGGAGGLFAADVADFLGIRTMLQPPNPGNVSAFGLHVSDIKRDYIRTFVRQQSTADAAEIERVWVELEKTGREEIMAEGVPADRISLMRSADMRYVGEGHEVPVHIPAGVKGREAVAALWGEFHNVHQATFGFAYEGRQDVELVTLRVQAVGQANRPQVARRDGAAAAEPKPTTRRVYWRRTGWTDCPIYRRETLPAGVVLQGPLIVEEYGSTAVVPEGWTAQADAYGNLKLEKTQ
jgi:N-methylhydantoinase A